MYGDVLIIILLFAAGTAVSVAGKLTFTGAMAGVVIAIILFIAFRFTGVVLLGSFFAMSVMATSLGFSRKSEVGLAESDNGRRNVLQVLANGGIAGLGGLVAIFSTELDDYCLLLVAAALSGASADTISSEIGSIYGRNFFDILSWRLAERGADGIISWQGTLAGLVASIVIAILYILMVEDSHAGFGAIIVAAGTIGNLSDSVLGATLERRHLLNNDAVNFVSTVVAAGSSLLLTSFI